MLLRAALWMAVLGLVASSEAQAKKNVRAGRAVPLKRAGQAKPAGQGKQAGHAKPAGQGKQEHTFRGQILSFDPGKGRITVAHHPTNKQANGKAANVMTRTFIITARTQIAAGRANLHKGTPIVVHYHGQQADRIDLVQKKKK